MKMVRDYDAASATVEIADDGERLVFAFLTQGPDHVFVSLGREAAGRLAQQIAAKLSAAPKPARKPS